MPTTTLFCNACKSVFCGSGIGPAYLEAYYSGYQGEEFIAQRIQVEPSFEARLEARSSKNTIRLRGEHISYSDAVNQYLLNLLPDIPERGLDVGGALGSNSPLRGLIPIDIADIDADAPAASHERESWPFISLVNVLEHVVSPIKLLRSARRQLTAQSSHVFVEVPVEGFMLKAQEQNFWKSKKIWTEHLICFSKAGLSALVSASGLELATDVEVRTLWSDEPETRNNGTVMWALARGKSSARE